ncbi:MAG: type III pantothenate kinase [Planctomycetota bacterium]|nr:MAG: type III pantothenate kinase [Planctomycetota bacterium]
MDLVADVGNTRAHLALFEGERLLARADVPHRLAPPDRQRAFAALLEGRPAPRRFALGSVNRRGRGLLEDWVRASFGLEPWILRQTLPDPLPLDVDAPEQVGADRVANATWAAHAHPGVDVVVIDLGTAITFDVVSRAGVFLGGAIAPGLGAAARALARGAELLPEVNLRDDERPPALGKTTEQCLRSGLFYGSVGLIEATLARLREELGARPRAVATGGDAPRVAPHCPSVDEVVPDVTLRGLHRALEVCECA